MRTGKIAGIFGMILCIFLFFFAGEKTGLFAGLSLLFVLSLSICYYCLLPKELPCHIYFPASGRKGKKVKGKFVIDRQRKLPIFFGKAYGKIKNQMTGDEDEFTLTITLVGREKGMTSIEVISEYIGCLEISVEKILFLGLLGIGKKEVDVGLKKQIIILPDTREMELNLDMPRGRTGDGEELLNSLRGFDSSFYQGVRPYREGDSLRQIHWKMTGKTEEYMVKELGEPAHFMPMVFLETTVERKEARYLDMLMEEYISVSQWLVEKKIPHILCWKDRRTGDWRRKNVFILEQLDSCFESLLCTSFCEGKRKTFTDALRLWDKENWWLCVMSNAADEIEMEQGNDEEKTIQFINTYKG